MSTQKVTNNWQDESIADLKSAANFIERSRFIHGLFLCHLVIEKSLKAIITSNTGMAAPKSHDINILAKKANFKFTTNDDLFISNLTNFKIQGRYPDNSADIPNKDTAEKYFKQTRALMQKFHKLLN